MPTAHKISTVAYFCYFVAVTGPLTSAKYLRPTLKNGIFGKSAGKNQKIDQQI